jgi:hypothetical protein
MNDEVAAAIRPPQLDYASQILLAFNLLKLPMYQGTASPYKVARQRAKNKVAKQSRKRNRG